MEVKMQQLAEHLESKIGQLNGSWISKNSSYEDNACIQLDFECTNSKCFLFLHSKEYQYYYLSHNLNQIVRSQVSTFL